MVQAMFSGFLIGEWSVSVSVLSHFFPRRGGRLLTMRNDYAHGIWLGEGGHWNIQFLGDAVGSMNMKAALWKVIKD